MTIRKGYADTEAGQLHYREAGEGPALVLLHWTPSSGRMFEAAMADLAGTHRVIALDLMGYGRSDRRPGDWLVGDFAGNVLEGLSALAVERCALYGGHMGAAIALEVAAQAPRRVEKLILDGAPAWDAETRAAIAKHMSGGTPPPIEEDGGHLMKLWQGIAFFRKEWDAERPLPEIAPEAAWGHVVDLIETGFLSSSRALVENDMAARASAVETPTLCLTADGDPLSDQHDKMLAALGNATGHRFAGPHPLHRPERMGEWVAAIKAFIN